MHFGFAPYILKHIFFTHLHHISFRWWTQFTSVTENHRPPPILGIIPPAPLLSAYLGTFNQ